MIYFVPPMYCISIHGAECEPNVRSFREFVSSFINFPKPLIAAVNGPAIGVSVTVLGLCDLVYAADNVGGVSSLYLCNLTA